jgi:hypothetical protein
VLEKDGERGGRERERMRQTDECKMHFSRNKKKLHVAKFLPNNPFFNFVFITRPS